MRQLFAAATPGLSYVWLTAPGTTIANIAGKYVGKDDPVAIVRTQNSFPATEEFGPPFAVGQFVAGDTRARPMKER